MQALRIIIMSLSSIVILFLLTKLIGNKQISQMNMFDYITGITIGSIAAEMATNLDKSPLYPVYAMIIYAVFTFVASFVSSKIPKARPFILGKPIVLLDNGNLYRKNFKKARLDLDEFLTLCRIAGYFDLSQIQTAIMEFNGAISFLPVEVYRNATPQDLALNPQQQKRMSAVIIDGMLVEDALKSMGKDEAWLKKQMSEQKINSYRDVFLAQTDIDNNILFFKNKNK